MIRILGLIGVFIGFSLNALSSSGTKQHREVIKITKVKKVTELDFEDSLIKGKLARPDGSVLLHRTESEGDSWLRLRESFKGRVMETRRGIP